ncbi:MAG: methylated-DNA--[protein]-cysteine S-methyltransferase [Clostridia bacterium]|nr:methylated-DNA--[protein]-cysteine S-methyltransferase [Clostridia bacterium]
MYYTRFDTQFCEIILVGDEQGLTHLHLNTGEGKRQLEISHEWNLNHSFFTSTIKQINDYFKGERLTFDIALNPKGTSYQRQVWKKLCEIPYGEQYTYKQLAINVGNEKASRAVGMANSKNPLPIIVPCHRVVGTNGKLTGFAHGLDIKKRLINLELFMSIFHTLLKYYGKQSWWPADTDYEMMVGAVLTQNTTWSNVVRALDNFNNRLSPELIRDITVEELASIIHPSGYYNQKAIKLKALNDWYERYEFDIEKIKEIDGNSLREELLEIKGIGRETADCILTYALKKPSFVIDTYTKRLFHRMGIDIPNTYDELRLLVESSIPKDLYIYNELHALIVKHAKVFCLKTPKCEGCPLYSLCKRQKD